MSSRGVVAFGGVPTGPAAQKPSASNAASRRSSSSYAVVVDHGGTVPEVLVLRRLGPREHRRRAGIGAREDLSPLVTRLAREALCEDLVHLRIFT